MACKNSPLAYHHGKHRQLADGAGAFSFNAAARQVGLLHGADDKALPQRHDVFADAR